VVFTSLLIVMLVVSLSVSITIPLAHASNQLKVGDTWTLSGTGTYTANGWGPEAGKYYETDRYTDTFKVDSFDGTRLAISEVFVDTWSYTATGWFINTYATSGTSTHNYRYIINATTLRIIAETWSKNDTGHSTYILIDPSSLVQGATLMRTWWTPYQGNSSTMATDVPWTVSGSQTIPFNGTNLQIWNTTHTGMALGNWYYYDKDTNTYPYSAGPETDVLQYDGNYGIFVGYSYSGTYTAVEHCSMCSGGWTDTAVYTEQLTSSNINLTS